MSCSKAGRFVTRSHHFASSRRLQIEIQIRSLFALGRTFCSTVFTLWKNNTLGYVSKVPPPNIKQGQRVRQRPEGSEGASER